MGGFTQASQLQGLAVTTDHPPVPFMEDQLCRTEWWCSDVIYSCPLGVLALGFARWCRLRSAPNCVLPQDHHARIIKQSESSTWAGLGDFLVKPNCESRLLVLGLGLTEASCCLFERI